MTVITRIAPGVSAAALVLGLAFAPAAFAQDPMQRDIDFRNATSRDDGARKATRSKDSVKKVDTARRKYGASK